MGRESLTYIPSSYHVLAGNYKLGGGKFTFSKVNIMHRMLNK